MAGSASTASVHRIEHAGWFDWSYTGVNFDLAGNGGQECQDFLSTEQRIIESVFTTIFSGVVIAFAFTKLTLPKISVKCDRDSCGRRVLLVVMCLTFGIELGFKLATRQMVYILNPCHVATMMQIFCLAAPPSRLVTAVFRMHLFMLSGAPIAIIFPVVNTRLLPFETEVYYIQHILMMVVPVYLILKGGVYTPEPLSDFSWAAFSIGTVYIYHFVFLHYLAFISKVNLNNMLCPAISDPFYGPYYRLCALAHQTLALPLLAKLLYLVCRKFTSSDVYCKEETKVINIFNCSKNSRQKAEDQGQTDASSSHISSSTVKSQGGSGDSDSEKNGVVREHNRQPSNGHIKHS